MADEIRALGIPTGLTGLNALLSSAGALAATVALTESPAGSMNYYASTAVILALSPALASGSYGVIVPDGLGGTYASGELTWNATNGSSGTNVVRVDGVDAATASASEAVVVTTASIGTLTKGVLSIVRGDAYTSTSGKAITIVKPAAATYPPDLTGWTITLTAAAKADLIASGATGATTLTTTLMVPNPSTTQELILESLSAATTGGLMPGINGWTFKITATSGTDVNTLMSGVMSVIDLTDAE